MRKIGIIGAGLTGRGFIAQLLAGRAELVFVDRDAELVRRLNSAGSYRVGFFGGARGEVAVENYRAYTPDDPRAARELTECGAILVSVRGENTREAGQWLLDSVGDGVQTAACENAADPAGLLPPPLCSVSASGAIFCTTVADGEIDILSEGYPELILSERGFPDALRGLPGFAPVADFGTLMKRKLYTYNASSGIIAYLGAQKGYESYADAANDPEISAALDEFYESINRAVCAEYGVAPDEQAEFAHRAKAKFQNRAIADSIKRNASSPERKLGASERIITPIALIERHGGDAGVLYRTAAAALRYAGADCPASAAELLARASGLGADSPTARRIIREFSSEVR